MMDEEWGIMAEGLSRGRGTGTSKAIFYLNQATTFVVAFLFLIKGKSSLHGLSV